MNILIEYSMFKSDYDLVTELSSQIRVLFEGHKTDICDAFISKVIFVARLLVLKNRQGWTTIDLWKVEQHHNNICMIYFCI